jgi:hypothetical protein
MSAKLLTLSDIVGTGDQTYTHTLTDGRAVKLRRLTHGEVRQFNQDVAENNYRVSDDTKDRVLAAALVEPALSAEDIQKAPGNMDETLDEIYTQAGRECGFLSVEPPKPTVYIPCDLAEEDARLIGLRFAIVKGERPEDDAAPLSPDAPSGSGSS